MNFLLTGNDINIYLKKTLAEWFQRNAIDTLDVYHMKVFLSKTDFFLIYICTYIYKQITQFLNINDMVRISNIHCFAYESTGDALYSGHCRIFGEYVDESRNQLVSEVESWLTDADVSLWGREN